MNKRNLYVITCLWIAIFLFVSNKLYAQAQCDDIQLTLTPTNSTCIANGSILVTVSGGNLPDIDQNTMRFSVNGSVFTHYAGNTITNLGPGTYTIRLEAFCNLLSSAGDWFIATSMATVTINSSYTVLDAFTGTPRKTLNCKPTGMVPVSVRASTGSEPFTITLLNPPPGYTGPTVYTLSRPTLNTLVTQNIDSLAAGSYSFEVKDACGYTQTINASVGTMSQDYAADIIYTYVYPPMNTTDCNTISFSRNTVSRPVDEAYYFYSAVGQYFELGVQMNGTGPITWLDTLASTRINYTLPPPMQLKDFIRTPNSGYNYFTNWVRIKGTTCEFPLNRTNMLEPFSTSTFFRYTNISCTGSSVAFGASNDYYGVLCYPYTWEIKHGGVTIASSTSPLAMNVRDTIHNVPYGSIIEFVDAQGYTWQRPLMTYPSVLGTYLSRPCTNQGMSADSIFYTYQYLYFNSIDSFPAGTRIRYLSGPSQTPPPIQNQDVILSTNTRAYFYPFSPTNTTTATYAYIYPGLYEYEFTLPGPSGCSPQLVNVYQLAYNLITPMTYTMNENCGGLVVKFTAGQLGMINYNNTVTNQTTYFHIYQVSPSIPYDTRRVQVGDSLVFSSSGTYVIAMSYDNVSNCPLIRDTIVYVKTPFTLNNAVTSAYFCEGVGGGGTGFIRVQGMGGSGSYKYELYDGATKVDENNSGVFYYGAAGNDYLIKLIDIDPACAASYEQTVHMLNLNGAQIAYSSSPTNTYCLTDSIYLRCITLGQTTYEWDGPGITSVNKNLQNPAIAAADIGEGLHTYTIKVTPEGCGHEMNQSITITVENCDLKKDATLLLTPDSIFHRGTLGNPVSVLYGDTILYEITAKNNNQTTSSITIRDTLPLYLDYVPLTATTGIGGTVVTGRTTGAFPRDTLRWNFASVLSMDTRTVQFKATPPAGAVASQPMFDNRAWVQVGNLQPTPSNYTYHQGADVSIVTFSAGFGGNIYNSIDQILDYRTTPHSGIVIAPDEGYRFTGWSHPDYLSLRGETIPAKSDIMLYDTLTVYGDVNLHANFAPVTYPITYYLHGGHFPIVIARNEAFYSQFTIESSAITLIAPEKEGDTFTGWTGSNGDEPQLKVTIPKGSTGERVYYANYQRSGREETTNTPNLQSDEDKIWVSMGDLYIYTSKPGSVVKIYTPDGILRNIQTILTAGETKIKLPQGIYIVTLNNSAGKKISIN